MLGETALLQISIGLYLGATALAVAIPDRTGLRNAAALSVLAAAVAVHALAIGLRWERLGHGPYVDLFEILSSNVWSLHAILLFVCLLAPKLRHSLPGALLTLSVLVLWLLVTPAKPTTLPVTYQTIWLPIHMVLGKAFLGLVVMAVGLSAIVVLRRCLGRELSFAPPSEELERLAHPLMLIAALFQSLMLVAGAAWARDAWGRYWSWDPLESWAFLTWLAMLAYLHWRPRNRDAVLLNASIVIGVYILAFATFFGAPFISVAPHKGAI